MSVEVKKKYPSLLPSWSERGEKNVPKPGPPLFEKDLGYAKILVAVEELEKMLDLTESVLLSFKPKRNIFGKVCGTTFWNTAIQKISCHVYIHKYSTLAGVVLCVAHELRHAYQIQNKVTVCEEDAETFSMEYLVSFLQKEQGIELYQAEGTAILVRDFLH